MLGTVDIKPMNNKPRHFLGHLYNGPASSICNKTQTTLKTICKQKTPPETPYQNAMQNTFRVHDDTSLSCSFSGPETHPNLENNH